MPCTVLGPGHEQQTLSDETHSSKGKKTPQHNKKSVHTARHRGGKEGGEAAAAAGQALELVQGAGGVSFL